ncbi:hypothetical protein FLJC2902T_02100 [Flavobacterium limnosediminis JC2902]|uniref:tRNA (Guanine-N1)-methyltransferase n=1 Tax=Flavobacterium limnosediminis JC2902 TaxID=1341181 RepID=V6SSX7_9FLAO|nr:hypothetical protein [Flavobacterium limnosediminis]ESU29736.1 hypothetical protein FLJC2902T_02100 [Flavobacterium limnosediminis JC2902]
MKKLTFKSGFTVMASLLTVFVSTAQEIEAVPEKPITKKVVESQMNQIMVNSSEQHGVKMVTKSALEELNADMMTLLSRNESDLANSKAIIESKNSEIKKLQNEVAKANTRMSTSDTGNETFVFFGMQLSKSLYHAIMWTLVLTLSIFVVFLVTRFKSANGITRQSKEKLTEVEDEFELFKRNAIEREQKLRRQLQDEINRQKKMLVDVS